MKVVVASMNEAKAEAVRDFFYDFMGRKVKVISVEADSGVSKRPIGKEVFLGTVNRLRDAINKVDDANYYVAIEGGYFKFGEEYFIGTAAAVCTKDGLSTMSTGISDFYKIPKSAYDCTAAGISLNEIMNTDKQKEGILGFLTDGKTNRKQDALQALTRVQEDVLNKRKWDSAKDLPDLLEEKRTIRLENENYFKLEKICTEKLSGQTK